MMFYTQLFTSKRGPLAKIWLAAHWERKLTKAHVFECNLETTIRDIISPKMKIGLRTSGHLLLGVVRIYSRKAKYLLADCNDALIKIRIAFRPGQTDLPEEGLEATVKAITLSEDFSAFDTQLPPLSNIDVVDHFSLNQCRSEEITLKEDFGNGFLNFADIGDSQDHNRILDASFHSLAEEGDAFGDEDRGFDLLDFLTNSSDHTVCNELIVQEPENGNPENPMLNNEHDAEGGEPLEDETPTLNETTLLTNEDEAFALEPVTINTNSERKKGKQKRKLIVDEAKELTNEFIREQLSDYSDLVGPFDMAPPTVQLMQWKETGGADKLFAHPCSTVIAPQINELFVNSIFRVKYQGVGEETEQMRHNRQEVQMGLSSFTMEKTSVIDSPVDAEITHSPSLTVLDQMNSHHETYSDFTQDVNEFEVTHPELPSEDSMFAHSSLTIQETESTLAHSQRMLDSQELEERRMTRRAKKLLNTLRSQSDSSTMFSLKTLCKGTTRLQAATTFFSLLVLKKQQAVCLHQRAPYEDISVTPGSQFLG
ncbi:double-strand-break repair protein rad21-like protein 1 [Betta splendens]|uniref:Double-strand-break repair protein rad21-like protein 1 n=1 Tax=Betta splendens TaxID=158456 RepID=A0A6P7MZK4_BETSP|nr:double-strand-break repair protein rad21-like protein 1 [Betta splendens]